MLADFKLMEATFKVSVNVNVAPESSCGALMLTSIIICSSPTPVMWIARSAVLHHVRLGDCWWSEVHAWAACSPPVAGLQPHTRCS